MIYFKTTQILMLGGIPILVVGWFFNKRAIGFTVLFLFTIESFFLIIIRVVAFNGMEDVIQGILIHIFFSLIAIFLNKIKTMGNAIKDLNAQLLIKNRELEEISLRDDLTQLHNRRYAKEFLFEYAERFIRQLTTPEVSKRDLTIDGKVMIVILADIDDFKHFNDTYGHTVGDKVLVEVSKRISDAVRFDDVTIRWGGEEFLIVCPLANKDFIEKIITKVLYGVRESEININNSEKVTISISIGALCFPIITESPALFTFDQAIILSDMALYDSKSNGRNQARYIEPNVKSIIALDKIGDISMDEFFKNRQYSTIHVLH